MLVTGHADICLWIKADWIPLFLPDYLCLNSSEFEHDPIIIGRADIAFDISATLLPYLPKVKVPAPCNPPSWPRAIPPEHQEHPDWAAHRSADSIQDTDLEALPRRRCWTAAALNSPTPVRSRRLIPPSITTGRIKHRSSLRLIPQTPYREQS